MIFDYHANETGAIIYLFILIHLNKNLLSLNKISGEWDNALLGDLLKELELTGYDITLTGFDLKEAKDLYGKGSMENVHEDNFNPEKEVKEIKDKVSDSPQWRSRTDL